MGKRARAPNKQNTLVDTLVAANVEPTQVGRSGRLILKGEAGSVALAKADGKLTPAGKHYFEKTGKQ